MRGRFTYPFLPAWKKPLAKGSSRLAMFVMMIMVIVALLAPYLASHLPLYVSYQGRHIFPAFTHKKIYSFTKADGSIEKIDVRYTDWKNFEADKKIFPLIPYSPGLSDISNAGFKSPFEKSICRDKNSKEAPCSYTYQHWLGTNAKGEDLLSGLMHGAGVSLKIGFFSITIALCIGIVIGLAAGYYRNDSLQVNMVSILACCITMVPFLYIASIINFYARDSWTVNTYIMNTLSACIYGAAALFSFFLSYTAGRLFPVKRSWYIPVDSIVSRGIEVFTSVPKLMVIVTLAAMMDRSITNVILIIGFTSWSSIARLVRAETLKLRSMDFIASARALGLSTRQVIFRHILPNIYGPMMVAFIFGVSSAILVESGLSFLNIGVPEGTVTWGQLLADSKQDFHAWWMVLFPGLAILITLLCLNSLAEGYGQRVNPEGKI